MNIVLKITDAGNVEASTLVKLKNGLGMSLAEVKEKLKPNAILLNCEPFMNDHDEIVEKITSTVQTLKQANIPFSIHEMDEGHEVIHEDLDSWQISEETLFNILNQV